MSGHPFAFGSDVLPGLAKLSEECGEVVQVIGKLMMTGGSAQHWDGTDLIDRLSEEVGDVAAAITFLVEHGIIDPNRLNDRAEAKLTLFQQWHREQSSPALSPPAEGARPETDMEHMARDMREGTFPSRSERKLVPDRPAEWWLERARREPDVIISAGLPAEAEIFTYDGDDMIFAADALLPWLKNYPPSTRQERAIEAANAVLTKFCSRKQAPTPAPVDWSVVGPKLVEALKRARVGMTRKNGPTLGDLSKLDAAIDLAAAQQGAK